MKNRLYALRLLAFVILLLSLNTALFSEDKDSSELPFARVAIELKYNFTSITPFPREEGKGGITFAGEPAGLLNTKRIRILTSAGWDSRTRYLFYSRKFYDRTIELPRYADYLINARVYGKSGVNQNWIDNLHASSQKQEKDKGGGLMNFKIDLPDVGGFLKNIAGEGSAGLNVSGYQKITFSGRSQWTDNSTDAINKVNKFPSLDMKQVSRYAIKGTIGTKITVDVDQNSERKTDLANRLKIRYKGGEDEILQTIDAGNTDLSLPNTQFVGYSQHVQGLFGLKATARVGSLNLTAIVSQEKGSTESSSFSAGASKQTNTKRDYDYLERTFFWLGDAEEVANISDILDYEIYVLYQQTNYSDTTQWTWARVAIHPDRYGEYPNEDQTIKVKRLQPADYYVYKTGYLEIFTYDKAQLIAGWFKIRDMNGDTVEIGSHAIQDTLLLKLIALQQNVADSSYQTWQYEWRNVYNLGVRDIDPSGIEVQIYKGISGTEDQVDANPKEEIDGTPFIEILGLDRMDEAGNQNPDGRIDAKDPNILLRDRGYLHFPDPKPFDPDTSYARNGRKLTDAIPQIYNTRRSTITGRPADYTKYYIQYRTQQRQTEYYLGHINIIENSERVVLNGEELKRDRDYRISYELGRITFLTDKVADPNANLKVDFEYEPFIASEKKNLFGIRGEYEVSPNFKLGTTVLYKGEKSTDRKPRVGQESSRYLVWDSDFSFSTELPFLTTLTDALPFIEASVPSRLSVSGELAQSRPKPNVAGEAFVDDFESAKEAYGLGVTRYQWSPASAPDSFFTSVGEHGKMIWYNPYDAYSVTDIYRRDVKGNDRKTTLTLQFEPARQKLEPNPLNPDNPCDRIAMDIAPDSSWGGVMRTFSTGSQDQTRSQLLELRMRVNFGRPIEKGKIYIDFGDISEDINGNGNLDTEDADNNGILQESEDIGLDHLPDPLEPCYDPITNPDPNGDDYDYSNKDDYSKINGTEGNRFDAGGKLPDTEDLDRKGSLNLINKYFEFLIDFENDKYLVPESDINGWVTYRIPIKESGNAAAIGGTPDWGRISFSRVWLTNFDSAVTIEIADMNLVTTRWEEDSIRPATLIRDTSTTFNISVINTEENLDYTPPPGVGRYYDKATDTYEKEQSLLFHFENLKLHEIAGDSGRVALVPDTVFAARKLFKSEDYAGYQKIKMFVHGPKDLPALQASPIRFIYRMGLDSNNFYQYQTNIYPGWHDSNQVAMDFNLATPMKDELAALRAQDPSITILEKGHYAVKGNPSLTSIIYFAVGVTRTDSSLQDLISGDLWLDELRLTDVRDNPGTAVRLSGSGSLSDFITYSVNYQNQDEYFRNLTSGDRGNLGSGKRDKSLSYSTSANLQKFLPPSWGVSLPISYSWSKSESTPRLKPGSDIILPDSLSKSQTSTSTSRSFSISESFSKKSKNIFWSLFLNRIRTAFSYSDANSKSPTVPVSKSNSYTASGNYDLTPRGTFTLPIFFWLKPIPLLPKSLKQSQFGYLPSKLTFSASVRKNYSFNLNNQNYRSETYTRNLDGNAIVSWPIFKCLTTDYTIQTRRDIRDPEQIKFSLNPKAFVLGTELENVQTFQLNYAPALFKFLTHKISYRADYRENADPSSNRFGTRNINNGNAISLNGSFSPKVFFGTGATTKGAKPSKPAKPETKGAKPETKGAKPETEGAKSETEGVKSETGGAKPETEGVKSETGGAKPKTEGVKPDSTHHGGISIHKPFLAFIRFFTNRLDDITGGYTVDNKFARWGLESRPTWKYIFGFVSDPGVPINDSAAQSTTTDVGTKSISYNAQTGVRFILGTKIATKYAHSERTSSTRNTKAVGTTFPDLSFSLANLEKYKLVKFFFNSLTFNTGYSRKIDENITTAGGVESVNDRSTSTDYAPLLGLNFTWLKKLSCNFKYDKSVGLKEQFQAGRLSSEVRSTSSGWQFSTRASISSTKGIKLPIFGTLKSSLTISVDLSKRNSKSESNQHNGKGWSTTSDKSDFSVMPRITYSFSTNINGQLSARWQDSDDKTRFQKSHVRELGISVEINF